jgi:hypothetical protein
MFTKALLTTSLLVTTMVAAAQAGSTITDKSYWPTEATRSAQSGIGVSRSGPSSAFAYDLRSQPTINPTVVEPTWRYRGGPKSR